MRRIDSTAMTIDDACIKLQHHIYLHKVIMGIVTFKSSPQFVFRKVPHMLSILVISLQYLRIYSPIILALDLSYPSIAVTEAHLFI